MTDVALDIAILKADHGRRSRIVPVLNAALAAVDPAAAVSRVLPRQGNLLTLGQQRYDLDRYRRVILLSVGKAAAPMAQAVATVLQDRLAGGLLLTKYGHGPATAISGIEVLEAGHPVPDEAGVAGSRCMAQIATEASEDDLVFCLVSGGGSALLTYPATGLSLSDLQITTSALLRCGASINEINALRKHLEQLKGGQLARLVAPATLLTLVLSDVVGSPLDVIASGPTVPDSSTWSSAWQVVEHYALQKQLPLAVLERLEAGLAGQLPDTPKQGDPLFSRGQTIVVADNDLAAQAAANEAATQGFTPLILSTFVEGEASEVARLAVALGREVVSHARPTPAPACLILGGETTVTLRGQGLGGRNQELALAAALLLDQTPAGERMALAALATDGTDGPTDAAGGLVDAATVNRGQALGLDAAAHLAANNAYPFLRATGDLLMTGPNSDQCQRPGDDLRLLTLAGQRTAPAQGRNR